MELSVTERGEGRIMSDGHKGASILSGQTEQQVDDACAGGGIEVACRFIGKENAGIIHQRAGNGNALLLASAELRGEMIETIRKTDAIKQCAGLCLTALGCQAAEHGREENIFERRQFRKQEVGLKDKSHPHVAEPGLSAAMDCEELFPLKFHAASARMLQTSQNIKQGRFSSSGWAAQKNHLAAGHIKIDTAEYLQMSFSQIIGLAESPCAEMDGVVGRHREKSERLNAKD